MEILRGLFGIHLVVFLFFIWVKIGDYITSWFSYDMNFFLMILVVDLFVFSFIAFIWLSFIIIDWIIV